MPMLMLWVLLKLEAPFWCYVLLLVVALIKDAKE